MSPLSAVHAIQARVHPVDRRPWHLALGAAVAGLLLAPARPAAPLGAGAAAALLAAVGVRPGRCLTAAALVLAGAALGGARLEATAGGWLERHPGARLEARAVLLEHPRPGRFGSRAELLVGSGPGAGERLLALAGRGVRWPAAGPGAEVAVRGRLRRPRASPGAAFSWPSHLRRRGIGAELAVAELEPTGRRRGGVAGAVDRARRRAEAGIATGLPPPRAALARGMVLGQDARIPEPVRDDFRRSGLAHILAVSGQNVMLLCALATVPLAGLGLGPRARVAALLALVAVYVPLAGAGPSLQRAAVMGAAGLVALAAGRPSSRWYALLLAAAITLGVNPRAAGDPGWQLSFAAVIGIALLAPPLRRALRGLPRPVAEGLAMTLAATAATAPLLGHHFGAVSPAGVPANVVALPLVAVSMWLGMTAAAVAQLPAALASPALSLLGPVNGACLWAIEAIAARFAQAPGAAVAVALDSPARAALAYAALAAAALALARAARRAEPWLTTGAAALRRLPLRRRAALAAAGAALAALVTAAALSPPAPPRALTVSFLDVGQGDATLVQHPGGGAVLFDGGPPEARVTRLLRAAGVRRLSLLVATHASRDHHGGLAGVLERVPVDALLDGGDGSRDPAFRAVLAAAERRGVRRIPATAGQTLRAGGLTLRVLSPPPRPPGPPPDDPNPRAVVALVSAGGFDLFLSADAESPALARLDLPPVEAMKVPHHGSRDEGLPELLARLRPRVAAIEVGEGNGYGHPAPETLRALAAAGVPAVHRTDRDGTVRVEVEGGRMAVETER